MAPPTRPIALPSIPADELAELTRCVSATGAGIDTAELEADLLGVLYGVGIAHDESDESLIWNELAEPGPDHKKLAQGYRRIAEAPAPPDASVCTAELGLGLNRQIDLRWTSRWRRQGRGDRAALDVVTWMELSPEEQGELREMALHLEAYHKSFVRVERPRKDDLDTILDLLADVFARHAGLPQGRYDLPHSISTPFIRFAARLLRHCYDPSEVSVVALARRWKRMKVRREQDAVPVTGATPEGTKTSARKRTHTKPQKLGWRPRG